MEKNKTEYALTRRMESVVEGLGERFASFFNTSDFVSKINYLKKCDSDETGSVQAELIRMFEKCGVHDIKMGQKPDYYLDKLNKSPIPTPPEMAHKVYDALFQEFKKNPFPLPEDYIRRMVAGKIPSEWENDSLRLKILKKFIKDAKGLKGAGYKELYIKQYIGNKINKKKITEEDILLFLDDGVFDALKGADNQQSRKSGKYGLLKIADDLAQGRFCSANVVREEIYIFAIVFELTYFTWDEEELVTFEAKSRDIEKVMFGDYYSNNIMRFISNAHKKIRTGGEEQNPIGKGINYKNYMEVIFLYYLRRIDLSVEEKINHIYALAGDIHSEFLSERENNTYSNRVKDNVTQYFGNSFKSNVIKNEEEFKEFVINGYDCSIPPNTALVFSAEIEQKSALNAYNVLLKKASDCAISEDDYKEIRVPFLDGEIDIKKIKKTYADSEKEDFDFDKIDDKTKFDILLYEVGKNLVKPKSESELKQNLITRNDILRLFYMLYVYKYSEKEDDFWKGFQDVYVEFIEGANQHLEKAFLRPVDGRNLYDIILIYSAYSEINHENLL